MLKFWLYIPVILIAVYFHLTWVPTFVLMSQKFAPSSSPQGQQGSSTQQHQQQNFIYTPLESGSYIEDTQVTLLSPFVPEDAEKAIVVVGGGLAGLSTAIETVDQFYERFESVLKFFSSNLKANDYRDVIIELESLPLEVLHEMIKTSDEVYQFLDNVSKFKVFILDKESKIGGNSVKASSGINAVNTENQSNWFLHQSKTNPDDDKKHPDLYRDSIESFLFDTMKSSISPEPPIWESPSHSTTSSFTHQSYPDDELLRPLSPFTPELIQGLVRDSPQSIPFLEQHQIFEFVGKIASILYSKYYPLYHPTTIPSGQSKRHVFTPPKHIELFLTKFAQLGGHSHPRTHRPGPQNLWEPMKGPELPIGAASINSLSARLGTFPYNLHISIITDTELVGLTYPSRETVFTKRREVPKDGVNCGPESRIVNGVVYKINSRYENAHNLQQHLIPEDIGKLFRLPAHSVVLATGGFSASATVLKKYAPHIAAMNLPTTNGPWATGDSISIGIDAGGAIIGMEMVQIHPTSFVVPTDPLNKVNFLAPEALRGVGGILLNLSGKRFINELTTRDVASRAIYWQDDHISYLVLSEECAKEFGGAINFYASKGIFAKTSQFQALGTSPQSQIENELTLAKRLGGVMEDGIDKLELVKSVNQVISTHHPAQSVSPTTTLFGVETGVESYTIIDTILTMLQLTATLKSKPKFTLSNDFIPLLTNVYGDMMAYSTYIDQKDDPFKRPFISRPTTFNFSSKQYYIAMITPAIHFTMGGLAIDTKARVIQEGSFHRLKEEWVAGTVGQQAATKDHANQSTTPHQTTQLMISKLTTQSDPATASTPSEIQKQVQVVKGLYAVGEASGGLHGRNRLGGNSLLECVVMGKRAAQTIVNENILPHF